MFNATISDPKLLRDSFDTISQIIDEATIRLKPDGIEILSADRAMVVVVDFKLSSKAFEKYECSNEISIGLNLINFLSLLKRASSSDKLTLKLNDEQSRLEIFLEGDSVRAFTLPIMDISREDVPDISKFEFPAKADINADIISRGIDDADVIADSVGVELSANGFRMFAEGSSSKSELKLQNDGKGISNLDASQLAKSRYPLDYMKKIMKAGKLVDIINVGIGNDYPMRLGFVGENVSVSFIVAPRVNEE